MDLYSGFCNICYKTADGSLKDISEENVKNLKDSLITFVGHADIVSHSIINLCQICCEELTLSNKFRKMCFTHLMQLPQSVFDMKSKLECFCNICYKTDDRCLKDTSEENMKNLKDTLITFVGHADIINDNIIHLCQSCCEELQRSNKFREICITHFIQLRQSVIDMISKLQLKDDASIIQNKLQIFVHQEVLRRYTLEKSNCPVVIPTEYEIIESSAVLSKNHSVFNRQIINLQSERNECPLAGDCSDLPVINSATECDGSQVAFKNEGFAFVKCEIESDEDVEYINEELHVKKEVVLSDSDDFECKSGGHVSEGMINSGIDYMKEACYVKQENRSFEDSKLQIIEDEFGDRPNAPIEFVDVCSIVKTEECEAESIAAEENAQDDMNLLSRSCNNKSIAAIMNARPSSPLVRKHRQGRCSTALKSCVHQRGKPSAEPHTSAVCNKSVYKRKHDGDKQFKNTLCNKVITQPSNLIADASTHSDVMPYKCTVCNKEFTHKSSLSVHERIHSGDRPYKCTVCNKAFARSFVLTVHERTHSDARPYKCTVCNKAFTDKSGLNVHERTHSGEKPYKCTVCNKAFSNSPHLTIHERIHSGAMPYKCTECNKAFRNSSNLNVHKRTHSGDRPYKCTVCNKAFTQSGALIAHDRTHTGDRPYKCTICNKTFSYLSALSQHKRSHTSDKPFKCYS